MTEINCHFKICVSPLPQWEPPSRLQREAGKGGSGNGLVALGFTLFLPGGLTTSHLNSISYARREPRPLAKIPGKIPTT